MSNVAIAKISLFCLTRPTFEECKFIELGCFTYNYKGIKGELLNKIDIFDSAELSIWCNRWSEFTSQNSSVKYINTLNDIISFRDLKNALKGVESTSLKNPFTIPFTHGLSYDYKNSHLFVKYNIFRVPSY